MFVLLSVALASRYVNFVKKILRQLNFCEKNLSTGLCGLFVEGLAAGL